MVLSPEETERFYRIWFPLLHYVNQRLGLVARSSPTPGTAAVSMADALTLRNALWADDALREAFIAENPARLPPADLAEVARWRDRRSGRFYVERYLKRYTVLLTTETPARAYGTVGLASPLEDIIGPSLPVLVDLVLLPFAGQIIYDSLLHTYRISFGPGIRHSIRVGYRNAQEREGTITTLAPPASPAAGKEARAAVGRRTATVLAAFRKDLARAGLAARTVEQHLETVAAFASGWLLAQVPPRDVLEVTGPDLEEYLSTAGRTVNRVSFRRFVRFLRDTERVDYEDAADLAQRLR